MGVCLTCRGMGIPGGCPTCGLDSLARKQTAEITKEVLDSNAIPERYRTVEWDPNILLAAHNSIHDDAMFARYCQMLTNCIKRVKAGELPDKSVLIVADRGFGKRTFSYCCMKECIKHGYKVPPILDTSQYKRLVALSSDRPFSKLPADMPATMEEVTNSDILFMTVDVANFRTAMRTIEAVCDRRSRVGKPTIITSRFSVPALASLDYFGDPNGSINRGYETDGYKYPYLIQFLRGFNNGQ